MAIDRSAPLNAQLAYARAQRGHSVRLVDRRFIDANDIDLGMKR